MASVPVYGYLLVLVFVVMFFVFASILRPDCNIESRFNCIDHYISEKSFSLRIQNTNLKPKGIDGIEVSMKNFGPVNCGSLVKQEKNLYKQNDVFDVILTNCTYPVLLHPTKTYTFDIKLAIHDGNPILAKKVEGTLKSKIPSEAK